MRFIVYETQTGIIKRIGNCDPSDVVLQAGLSETVVVTDISSEIHPDRHRIQDGQLVDYQAPVDIDAVWQAVRSQRNRLLSQCDWTQMSDSPLGIELKQSWAIYRQSLRDFPATVSDPTLANWPTPPVS